MRSTIILILFVTLLTGVHATVIHAPDRATAYSPFTVQVVMEPTDQFTSTTISFDGIPIATLYPSGACAIHPDWISFLLKCDTFDADPQGNDGLTAIITHTGFAVGEHTVSALSVGTGNGSDSAIIQVYNALDVKEKEAIDSTVGALTAQVQALDTKTIETEQKWYESKAELETKVNENNQRVDEMESTVGTLNADLQKRIEDSKKGFQIPFLSGNNDTSSPSTGLATGSNAPLIGLAVIIVGIAMFAFITFSRKQGKGAGFASAGGKGFFDGNMDALFKSVPQNSSGKNDPSPHKWAAESGEKGLRQDVEDNPPEKINFGDLIKQERP